MNKEKFENLVLAICESVEGPVTTTRLAKLLWLVDKAAYLQFGDKITGCRYIRKQFGPVPVDNHELLAVMREEGLISINKECGPEFSRVEYSPLRRPDMGAFDEREREVIENALTAHRNDSTRRLIAMSHDLAWALSEDGEEIPFAAYLGELAIWRNDPVRARRIIDKAELEYEN